MDDFILKFGTLTPLLNLYGGWDEINFTLNKDQVNESIERIKKKEDENKFSVNARGFIKNNWSRLFI